MYFESLFQHLACVLMCTCRFTGDSDAIALHRITAMSSSESKLAARVEKSQGFNSRRAKGFDIQLCLFV